MSTLTVAAPGPFEPDRCVPQGSAPARSLVVPAVIVIVIVAAWTAAVAAGVSPYATTAGLGAAAGLGVRIATWLRASGGARA
jgi:hypothetical protein